MKIIVQKFGGTSVASKNTRKYVIEKVKKAIEKGFYPVVVVSAMGRKGDPYSTDSLLALADKNVLDNNKQAKDLLMCCGELISSVVVSSEFIEQGIDAVPLSGGQAGIITDNNFTLSKVLEVKTKTLIDLLKQNKVPVVTGFQGITEDGFFTTLGRGGSDTSAAILGAALKAERIEIYTDVDGIMTADPRIVKDASVINVLNYDEVFQLADQGAKVIHPKAVAIAKNYNIPLYIKNTMSDATGTVINGALNSSSSLVTSITSSNNRVQVIIKRKENYNNKKYDEALEIIADNNISLDLINIFPDKQMFTVSIEDKNEIIRIFDNINIKYEINEHCSNIALVGSGMRGIPGVMAKIYKALNSNGIEVLQTADSHMTIWCLIKEKDLSKAINALHKTFIN